MRIGTCTGAPTYAIKRDILYALSYEWGPGEEERTILLNGRPRRVRKNLSGFLEAYNAASDACPGPLWVDAICINRGDIQERNRHGKSP